MKWRVSLVSLYTHIIVYTFSRSEYLDGVWEVEIRGPDGLRVLLSQSDHTLAAVAATEAGIVIFFVKRRHLDLNSDKPFNKLQNSWNKQNYFKQKICQI